MNNKPRLTRHLQGLKCISKILVAWVLLHLLLVINADYTDQLQILGTNLLLKLPGGVLHFSIYLSVNFQLQTNVWKNGIRS